MPSQDKKYFTPQEARRTLPLVKQIVTDILYSASQIRTIAESLDGNIAGNEKILNLASQIDSFIKELEEIGCLYKDGNFKIGLVDFPAVINNNEVMLCWRSDEDDIMFYHSMEEGFSGRKLIPEEYL